LEYFRAPGTVGVKSKLDGLLAIMEANLPHPDWRFFSAPSELPAEPWASASHGWTIRLCPTHSYQFGLVSTHYEPYGVLPVKMYALARTMTESFQFVVYPSWQFVASGGCHVSVDRLVIEVVRGSIASLLEGHRTPDLFLLYEGPLFSHLRDQVGDITILPAERLATLRSCSRRVWTTGLLTVVLEWSWCDDGRILFHDWVEG